MYLVHSFHAHDDKFNIHFKYPQRENWTKDSRFKLVSHYGKDGGTFIFNDGYKFVHHHGNLLKCGTLEVVPA